MSSEKNYPEPSKEVWEDNYKAPGEKVLQDTWERQAKACAAVEKEEIRQKVYEDFLWLLTDFKGIAGGRITANLGVPGRTATTLFNCFVHLPSDIKYKDSDSISGIYDMLKAQAQTLKSEGGYGMNFSWIRPAGAYVQGIASRTPGVLKFMEMWDKSSEIITMGSEKAIGERRSDEKKKIRKGAQMGILNCTHPEIEDFIDAKLVEGRLSKFNLSVGITTGFMQAVQNDDVWQLKFPDTTHPQYKEEWNGVLEEWESKEYPVVVYKTLRAKDLWDKIMRSTYTRNDPGVLFLDIANKLNPLNYAEHIQTTNPCFHGDERFLTDKGYFKFADSANRNIPETVLTDNKVSYNDDEKKETASKWQINTNNLGVTARSASAAFLTQKKASLLQLEFDGGQSLRCTPDHHIATTDGMIEAKNITSKHKILIATPQPDEKISIRGKAPETIDEICAFIMGIVAGDGCFSSCPSNIDLWGNDKERACKFITMLLDKLFDSQDFYLDKSQIAKSWQNRAMSRYYISRDYKADKIRIQSTLLKHFLKQKYSYTKETKTTIPEFIFNNARTKIGLYYLSGLFYADGSVVGDVFHGISVRLSQSNYKFLQNVQLLMLANGVPSRVYLRRDAGEMTIRGKTYNHKEQHELITVCSGWKNFAKILEYNHPEKDAKLNNYITKIKKNYTIHNYTSLISKNIIESAPVYCIKEDVTRSIIVNGITTRRCGEIAMSTGVCLLFSLNLVKYVKKENDKYIFDFETFKKAVSIAIRFADNINDISTTPLPEYTKSMKEKRRIGVGVLSLGSLHFMLGIRFGSKESLELIEQIFKVKAETELLTSAKLGCEKGSFELFDKHKYFNTYWWKTLPIDECVKNEIEVLGEMRNSHHSANAPTGNMSIYAECVSGGIEPVFAKEYYRWMIITEIERAKLRSEGFSFPDIFKGEWFETEYMKESKAGTDSVLLGKFKGIEYQIDKNRGLTKKIAVVDYGWQFVLNNVKNIQNDIYATTNELSVEDHVNTLKIIAKYVNMNSSKTVNLPNDYLYESFKNLYLDAYNSGIKGITSYRAGTMTAVLENKDNKQTEQTEEKIQRYAPKRPQKLVSETHKIRIDFGDGEPRNAYVTVSFFEDTRKPYEMFIVAPYQGLEEKDLQILELSARNTSLMLRHGIPIKFICEQLDRAAGQYIFSIPTNISKILKQYDEINEELLENGLGKCPSCGKRSYMLASGCGICKECNYSGCS